MRYLNNSVTIILIIFFASFILFIWYDMELIILILTITQFIFLFKIILQIIITKLHLNKKQYRLFPYEIIERSKTESIIGGVVMAIPISFLFYIHYDVGTNDHNMSFVQILIGNLYLILLVVIYFIPAFYGSYLINVKFKTKGVEYGGFWISFIHWDNIKKFSTKGKKLTIHTNDNRKIVLGQFNKNISEIKDFLKTKCDVLN